jgi:hypothetical protein
MKWNLEGVLCSGRERALLNLLTANGVGVSIITEAEIRASGLGDFNVEGYYSYLPHASDLVKSAKYRVVALVRSALATSTKIRLNLMHAAVQLVWIQLDLQGTTPVQVLVDLQVLVFWSTASTGSGWTSPGRQPPCLGGICGDGQRRPRRQYQPRHSQEV